MDMELVRNLTSNAISIGIGSSFVVLLYILFLPAIRYKAQHSHGYSLGTKALYFLYDYHERILSFSVSLLLLYSAAILVVHSPEFLH
jgi:hypothetical protein